MNAFYLLLRISRPFVSSLEVQPLLRAFFHVRSESNFIFLGSLFMTPFFSLVSSCCLEFGGLAETVLYLVSCFNSFSFHHSHLDVCCLRLFGLGWSWTNKMIPAYFGCFCCRAEEVPTLCGSFCLIVSFVEIAIISWASGVQEHYVVEASFFNTNQSFNLVSSSDLAMICSCDGHNGRLVDREKQAKNAAERGTYDHIRVKFLGQGKYITRPTSDLQRPRIKYTKTPTNPFENYSNR